MIAHFSLLNIIFPLEELASVDTDSAMAKMDLTKFHTSKLSIGSMVMMAIHLMPDILHTLHTNNS